MRPTLCTRPLGPHTRARARRPRAPRAPMVAHGGGGRPEASCWRSSETRASDGRARTLTVKRRRRRREGGGRPLPAHEVLGGGVTVAEPDVCRARTGGAVRCSDRSRAARQSTAASRLPPRRAGRRGAGGRLPAADGLRPAARSLCVDERWRQRRRRRRRGCRAPSEAVAPLRPRLLAPWHDDSRRRGAKRRPAHARTHMHTHTHTHTAHAVRSSQRSRTSRARCSRSPSARAPPQPPAREPHPLSPSSLPLCCAASPRTRSTSSSSASRCSASRRARP